MLRMPRPRPCWSTTRRTARTDRSGGQVTVPTCGDHRRHAGDGCRDPACRPIVARRLRSRAGVRSLRAGCLRAGCASTPPARDGSASADRLGVSTSRRSVERASIGSGTQPRATWRANEPSPNADCHATPARAVTSVEPVPAASAVTVRSKSSASVESLIEVGGPQRRQIADEGRARRGGAEPGDSLQDGRVRAGGRAFGHDDRAEGQVIGEVLVGDDDDPLDPRARGGSRDGVEGDRARERGVPVGWTVGVAAQARLAHGEPLDRDDQGPGDGVDVCGISGAFRLASLAQRPGAASSTTGGGVLAQRPAAT